MTLREVVHAHIPVLTLTSTVRDAIDKMDVYQFPALVVVDDENRPIAVLTEGDLCRAVAKGDSLMQIASDPAHIYGTSNPTTVSANAEVSDALHKMLGSGLTVLPVVDQERLEGVVLRMDLMQAMLLDSKPES